MVLLADRRPDLGLLFVHRLNRGHNSQHSRMDRQPIWFSAGFTGWLAKIKILIQWSLLLFLKHWRLVLIKFDICYFSNLPQCKIYFTNNSRKFLLKIVQGSASCQIWPQSCTRLFDVIFMNPVPLGPFHLQPISHVFVSRSSSFAVSCTLWQRATRPKRQWVPFSIWQIAIGNLFYTKVNITFDCISGLPRSFACMNCLTTCLNVSAPGHHITGNYDCDFAGNILDHIAALVRHSRQWHIPQTIWVFGRQRHREWSLVVAAIFRNSPVGQSCLRSQTWSIKIDEQF